MSYKDKLKQQSIRVAEHIVKSSGLSFEGMEYTIKQVAEIYENAIAEREAQVRAEEREKVAELVEALRFYANSAWLHVGYKSGQSDENPHWDEGKKARAVLATYNDNRKG